MQETGVAARYSRALMGAAEEQGVLEAVEEDVQGLIGLLRDSEDLCGFLADLLIHPQRKEEALRSLLTGKLQGLTLNFLSVLCEKGRGRVLENILQQFVEEMDERRGVVTAQVRSAVALSSEQQGRLAERLTAYIGKEVNVEITVDEAIKAGFVARLDDKVFDGTLETQLSQLHRLLSVR